jgi:hypothetical protein
MAIWVSREALVGTVSQKRKSAQKQSRSNSDDILDAAIGHKVAKHDDTAGKSSPVNISSISLSTEKVETSIGTNDVRLRKEESQELLSSSRLVGFDEVMSFRSFQ